MRWYRSIRLFLLGCLVVFVCMNIVAYFHATRFTRFDPGATARTHTAIKLTRGEKLKALLFGVSNPRPQNMADPAGAFSTVQLNSSPVLEGWHIPQDTAQATVILFHGYGGMRSSLLGQAAFFQELGYNTVLVDFRGSGGSGGNTTTIGFHEAQDVRAAYVYVRNRGEERIILFGTSMGAVAIMKAIHDHALEPTAIILECPFGTMQETVEARFSTMDVPTFPMAHLLVLWGGLLNGFNAFGHNPIEYAERINIPTLLLYGERDENVSRSEIDRIFGNLRGPKVLRTYAKAGHENFAAIVPKEWTDDIRNFLGR